MANPYMTITDPESGNIEERYDDGSNDPQLDPRLKQAMLGITGLAGRMIPGAGLATSVAQQAGPMLYDEAQKITPDKINAFAKPALGLGGLAANIGGYPELGELMKQKAAGIPSAPEVPHESSPADKQAVPPPPPVATGSAPPKPSVSEQREAQGHYMRVMRNGRETYTNIAPTGGYDETIETDMPGGTMQQQIQHQNPNDQLLGVDDAQPQSATFGSAFGKSYTPVTGGGNFSQMNDNRMAMMNPMDRATYDAELAKKSYEKQLYGIAPQERARMGQKPDVGVMIMGMGLQIAKQHQMQLAKQLQDLEGKRKTMTPEAYQEERQGIVEGNKRSFEMYRDMLGLGRGVRPIPEGLMGG